MIDYKQREEILDLIEIAPSVTEMFQHVNSVIPENQDIDRITIKPETRVVDAFEIMQRFHYSQLPVGVGNKVLGIFSYQSFSKNLLKLEIGNLNIQDLPVEEFLEKPEFIQIEDEIDRLMSLFDIQESVIVGSLNLLQAIVTPLHVASFLHKISYPFILLYEFELTLRELLRVCVSDDELSKCIENSLGEKYKRRNLPTSLEEMVFHDYMKLIEHDENWLLFSNIFSSSNEFSRNSTITRLNEVRDLRNIVFHFKRALTENERSQLLDNRDWLLMKARSFEARATGR